MLQPALDYATKLGWHVFPVHYITGRGGCSCQRGTDCDRAGKHPATANGLKDATVDTEQIREWWQRRPGANIGVACRPSKLVVIDLDKGGDESYRDLVSEHGGNLTDTVLAITGGGGSHIVFRALPGGDVPDVACSPRWQGPLGPGIDIRAQGYFVAPPSIHHTGNTYEWEVSPYDREPAPLPVPIYDLLRPPGEDVHPKIVTADLLAGVPEGQRDWSLFLLACKLRGSDVPIDWAYQLIAEAAANCDPPFNRAEARQKVENAYSRYPAGETLVERIDPDTGEIEKLFIWASELDSLPDPEWLVDEIMQQGAIGSIIGQYGLYKTFIALDLACSIATGKHWHGKGVKAGPVVYIYAEGLRGLRRRVRAWEAANGHTVQDVAFVPRAVQLMTKEDVEFLLSRITAELEEPPVAVFIDTLSRAMAGGNENQQQDMGVVIAAADRIARETGAAVWFLHHTNRKDEYRGSTVLPGALDTMVIVSKKNDTNGARTVTIHCDKQKDAEEFADLELIAVPHDESLAMEVYGTWQAQAATISKAAADGETIIKTLGPNAMRRVDLATASGLSKDKFRHAMDDLLRKGAILRDETSGTYSASSSAPNFEPNDDDSALARTEVRTMVRDNGAKVVREETPLGGLSRPAAPSLLGKLAHDDPSLE